MHIFILHIRDFPYSWLDASTADQQVEVTVYQIRELLPVWKGILRPLSPGQDINIFPQHIKCNIFTQLTLFLIPKAIAFPPP